MSGLIILITCVSLAYLFFLIMVRNTQVFNYLTDLIARISVASDVDISRGTEWRWRYDEIDKLNQLKMVLMFWKPLDSFCKDKSFLDHRCKRIRTDTC